MESMIERVAMALKTCAEGEQEPWTSDQQKRYWSCYAEAAIEALREPTEAMEDWCLDNLEHTKTGIWIWQSLIDAALKEHERKPE